MKLNIFSYKIAVLILLLTAIPFSFTFAQALTSTERTQLEAQLAEVLAEETQAQASLSTAQSKSSSLQNDINLLAAKIKAEQLDIQAKNLKIQTLGDNISTKQITALDNQITQNKQDIESIFRQIQQADNISLFEIVLSSQTISGFLDDTTILESLQQQIDAISAQLAANEASSTAAKNVLVTKQNAASTRMTPRKISGNCIGYKFDGNIQKL